MSDNRGITEGLPVYSQDRFQVGRVVRCGSTRFEVEKGFFFPRDYALPYELVGGVEEGVVFLTLSRNEVRDLWRREELLGDRAEITPPAVAGYTTRSSPAPSQADFTPQTHEEEERLAREYHRNAALDAPPWDEHLNTGAVEDEKPDASTEGSDDQPMLFEGRREVDDYLF